MLGASFGLDVSFAGARYWDVTVHGFIESEPTFSSDEGSACWILLMTLTPTFMESTWGSTGIASPDVGWVSDGQHHHADGGCAGEDELPGWSELGFVESYIGTPTDVYASFLFEDEATPAVDAIYFGGERYDDEVPDDDEVNVYLTAETIEQAPPLSDLPSLALPEAVPLAGQQFVAVDFDVFAVTLHGLIEMEAEGWPGSPPGKCLVLLGESFPVEVFDATVESSSVSFELLAGGHFIDDTNLDCDTDVYGDQGFAFFDPKRTIGTSASFHMPFFVPDRLAGDLTHVVIGRFTGEQVQFFQPDLIDSPPPVAAIAADPMRPVTSGSMAQDGLVWVDEREEVTWQIDLNGLFDAGPDNEGRQCLVVTATVTPDVAVDRQFQLPDWNLIAAGINHTNNYRGGCDVSAFEAQGWINDDDFDELAAGEAFDTFSVLHIPPARLEAPSVFAVGSPSTDWPSVYLEPVFVQEIPTP